MQSTTNVRLAAIVSIAGIALFAVIVGLLHLLEPELDPSWRFLSEYATGRYGWVMTVAFSSWSAATAALFFGLGNRHLSGAARAGRYVLLAVAASLIVAGLFAMDPLTAKPHELTRHGAVHAWATMVGIPGIPIAAILVTGDLRRSSPRAGAVLRWTAHLTWVTLALMMAYLAVSVPRAGGFGPSVFAGWMNRLVVFSYVLWQASLAVHLRRSCDHAATVERRR